MLGAFGGAVMGQLFNQWNMATQHQYNEAENRNAADLNFKYNEEAANRADSRARAFYNDFNSPEAIRKQLESAGLSVGLMYGGAGANGQGHASTQGAQGAGSGNQQGKTVTPNGAMMADMALTASQVEVNKAEANKLNSEADANKTYRRSLMEAEALNWQIKNAKDEATLWADVSKAWRLLDDLDADIELKRAKGLETLSATLSNLAGIQVSQAQTKLFAEQAYYFHEAGDNFDLTREQEKELREKGFDVDILKNNGKLGLAIWYGKKYLDLFDMDGKGHALGKPQDGPTTGVKDKNGTRTGYKMGDLGGMK